MSNNVWSNLKQAVEELKAGQLSTSDSFEVVDIANDVTIIPTVRQKSLITEGMSIEGDIHLVDADLEIFGKINGNIECNGGSVYIFNSCVGNITAQCIFLSKDASVVGNLNAHDVAQIDEGCILKGHITVIGSVSVKGTLVGNIDTRGAAYLGANSVINGDISSASIEISKGAKLNGNVKILQEDSVTSKNK